MSGDLERLRSAGFGGPPCPCGQVSFDHTRAYHDRHREIIQAAESYRRTRAGSPGQAARPAGELDPEWAMVGVDVPAGKRLYASRHLKGTAFELAVDEHMNGEGWHLATVMQRMLVITKPTYAECLAELARIWANWESEGRELPASPHNRKALP